MDNTRLVSKEFKDTLSSRFKAFNYIFNGYITYYHMHTS